MFEIVGLLALAGLLLFAFIVSGQAYREIGEGKGVAPTPVDAAANAGQSCLYWVGWIGVIFFLIMVASVIGGAALVGGGL